MTTSRKWGIIAIWDMGAPNVITREEIVWLYRCILGREPESDEVIETNLEQFDNFAQARLGFIDSREFQINSKGHNDGGVAYIPARKRDFEKVPNKIALASIVKDESKRVEGMLRSALPLVDFVALVDTGSSDDTFGLAEKVLRGSNVKHQMLREDFVDFAYVRNASLALIPNWIEWVLVLDADEHIVQEDYQKFVDLTDIKNVDAWNLPRFNFVDPLKRNPAAPYPDFQSRLFRHREDSPIHYEGAVHEVLVNVRNWGVAPINGESEHANFGGPHIHHMGQVGLTLERFHQKHSFYESLMRLVQVRSIDDRFKKSKMPK